MFTYIKVYNLTGVLVCCGALVLTVLYYWTKKIDFLLYLVFCQCFFILEILNIKMGKSNSTILPTFLQLLSRIFIIGIICYLNKLYNKMLILMCVCWYISDLIRYLFYLTRNSFIRKVRYNAFIVLYPVGTSIEIYLCNGIYLKYSNSFISYLMGGIIMCYVPGFIFLYYHMIRQRISYSKNEKRGKRKVK
ncbi:protein tyrosine phosphatase-like protein [Hamiltosporidium tvaerminnensis]|uniref:Very-long-chain (3R)-3-hydroxyacyl-CoA dehydratase n=1 Tax=Hamiltosporidium tvaerminnensis TaxID=1176355 RepID=A0A4Q9LBS9_9MICR|nr:protein tyrosine phosphatase-like protein [Hamiltosporidium tvaerminnensis]